MKRSSPEIALLLGVAFVAILGLHSRGIVVASESGGGPIDGKTIYANYCSGCHQASGAGGGPFPPLAGNADVTAADTSALISTLLNGRSGPLQIGGQTYGGVMPAWKGTLSDAQIAAVLTYIRSAWGNGAPIVTADQVDAASAPVGLSGAQIFATKCARCHNARGQGSAKVPPLAGNADVLASDPTKMC